MLSFTKLRDRNRPKVLVAAGEPGARSLLKHALTEAKMDVHTVDDLIAVYWTLKHVLFEVVVLEGALAADEGEEYRRLVRDEPMLRDIPFVLVAEATPNEVIVSKVWRALSAR